MNILFAHNGHNHAEEITQAASSNAAVIATVGAVVVLTAAVGLALLLKRKK